jgi:F0F1-type ATP synthase epsilon subunit
MAGDALLQIDLVTPERVLLTEMASEVVLRTGEGDITFLPEHTPLVGTVEPGVVRVLTAGGEEQRAAVHGGFTQVEQHAALDAIGDGGATGDGGPAVTGTRVTLLIGVAELADEIDVQRAGAAEQAATARIAELAGTAARAPAEGEEPDAELADADLLRAQVRLEAAGSTSSPTA